MYWMGMNFTIVEHKVNLLSRKLEVHECVNVKPSQELCCSTGIF